MPTLTAFTKDGSTWEPKFITAIDKDVCLGCGRCHKVCGRNVLGMQAMNEFGELIDDEDDDDDDIERYVMTIINAAKCIGCEACARICPKNCHTHEALAV
ncbi:MAG: ferredoxin III, nif-specific [Cyanobacteria bacterium]|jgi:Nif-specific ferredoxin III|nr:ferredoxin III, nif-specific [Cyanobacteria bacterium GSL.Bin1]